MDNLTSLAGRQWISSQEDFSIIAPLTKVPAISDQHCNRCGALVTAALPNGKKYCRACIEVGRIVEGAWLVRNQQAVNFPKLTAALSWKGKLTPLQTIVSQQLEQNFKHGQDTLVYAVTGAGKTEMLFAVIAECLRQGRRCCIASPRIDVVNELYPRLQAAFIHIKIGKYHGREFHEPGLEQLTLCTTHQLMKFYRAFDLLIVDEVDSFPYVADPQLHFAAANARKLNGVRIYLTATPTTALLKEVHTGQLQLLRLNRRFHGGLLPVPQERLFMRPFLVKGKLHPRLRQAVVAAIAAKHPLLLFVPRITEIASYLAALSQVPELKQTKIAGVHAADPDRLKKVEQFRTGQLQILVTTTILERGVTFNHVWVIIVQADDAIYSAASLVQIAGRVGRSGDDPDGIVLFCYHRYTAELRCAMKQIRALNR